MSGVKLDLFKDPDMHLFVENNIRGGVSVVCNRHAKANNSYTENGLDETENLSCICCLDANNLYGYAMSQPITTSEFRFLKPEEIQNLHIVNVPDNCKSTNHSQSPIRSRRGTCGRLYVCVNNVRLNYGVWGGVSVVCNRHAKANNSYTENGLDETESLSCICCLDANNLYSYAMSQPLTTSEFRFICLCK